jgi:hypothetical protein
MSDTTENKLVPITDWEAFVNTPPFVPYIPLIKIDWESLDDPEWKRRYTASIEYIDRSICEQLGTYLREEDRDM